MDRVLTDTIAASIVEVSPSYKLRTASCQTFAVDLALRIVETPSQALLDMKTEQTRLRMEKGEWDESILNHSAYVSHWNRLGSLLTLL